MRKICCPGMYGDMRLTKAVRSSSNCLLVGAIGQPGIQKETTLALDAADNVRG
jgi:hypothetical protein